jgi:hypothetical protein
VPIVSQVEIRAICPLGISGLGLEMSGKWFSNRGQIVQVAVAVLALVIAIIVALPALAQHQDLLSWLPIILIPAIALGAFSYGKNYAPPVVVPTLTPTAEPPAKTTGSLPLLRETEETFETEVNVYSPTVKVGSYWDDGDVPRRIRVAVVSISDEEEPRAELHFAMGALAHGGTQTKRTKVNQYLMRPTSSGFQAEEFCVTCFSFDERHVWFFVVRVDHVNAYGKEAVLSICKVSSHKRIRFENLLEHKP